jgi:hypothetical protein
MRPAPHDFATSNTAPEDVADKSKLPHTFVGRYMRLLPLNTRNFEINFDADQGFDNTVSNVI